MIKLRHFIIILFKFEKNIKHFYRSFQNKMHLLLTINYSQQQAQYILDFQQVLIVFWGSSHPIDSLSATDHTYLLHPVFRVLLKALSPPSGNLDFTPNGVNNFIGAGDIAYSLGLYPYSLLNAR